MFTVDLAHRRAQAGDKVVYSKYAGTEVAVDGKDYVLLKVTAASRDGTTLYSNLAADLSSEVLTVCR